MTKNIDRFCEVVAEINNINHSLEKEKVNFYHGGHSFEDCNAILFSEKEELHEEFKELIKKIKK